ncbi:unnamed protein product [Arabidopsis thaliana]|uniref:RING-type E3 ubiquitin transferase n=1 Tax=Arabidopsis thaliana TaxID=3702 RepID=A0A654G294_ARATH|nr:unnamed protein product [Arabidopsis thaliana]
MADSTADATETNADTLTLRRELKKVLTENLNDGGVKDRVETVKSIDEAIRILNRLKIVESKKRKRESDSSSVEVPKEFKCTLSKTIMIDPVIIFSGQTYEKRYITEWLNHDLTCPTAKQVLYRVCLTPNHLINELITRWCLANKYDRPAPKPSDIDYVTELFTDGIESLLQRISSPSSSVADQTEAAKELALQTEKFVNVRDFFIKELPDSITRLLTPLSVLGDEGSVVTRRNATLTLASLSDIDSNKIIIGNSVALKAMIDVIGELDDLSSTHEALCAVLCLCCDERENWRKAISLGLAPAAINNFKARRNLFESLAALALISPHERVIQEVANLGVIYDLLSILRKTSCMVTCENAVVIVSNMYIKSRERSIKKILAEEENQHKTFTKLATQGSVVAVMKAQGILQCINYYPAGMEPQRA